MRPLLAAVQFLTIFPLPSGFQAQEKDLRKSLIYFPIVGLTIGAAMAALDSGISRLFPPLPESAILVILMMAASGCFHMDGLADTADGFLSSRPKERILEIMKDSRVGPMGVIAIVCAIILKIAALSSVPEAQHWRVILLTPLAGRCALILGMKAGPYVRAQGGLASAFGQPNRFVVIGTICFVTAVSFFMLRLLGLFIAGITVLTTIVVSFWSRRKIGGFTGDTLGATCEIVEIIPAMIASAWGWQN
jgi:adenosylcobinamide-GDP ribazoletransferase